MKDLVYFPNTASDAVELGSSSQSQDVKEEAERCRVGRCCRDICNDVKGGGVRAAEIQHGIVWER